MDLFEYILAIITKRNILLTLVIVIVFLFILKFDKYYNLFQDNVSSIILIAPFLLLLIIYIICRWNNFIEKDGFLIIATILIPAFFIFFSYSEDKISLSYLVLTTSQRNCAVAQEILCAAYGQYPTNYFVTDVYKNNYAFVTQSMFFDPNFKSNLNRIIYEMESGNNLLDYVQKLDLFATNLSPDTKIQYISDHFDKVKKIALEIKLEMGCSSSCRLDDCK